MAIRASRISVILGAIEYITSQSTRHAMATSTATPEVASDKRHHFSSWPRSPE